MNAEDRMLGFQLDNPTIEARLMSAPFHGVAIATVFPQGELVVPMAPAEARNLAATLVEFADEAEEAGRGSRN